MSRFHLAGIFNKNVVMTDFRERIGSKNLIMKGAVSQSALLLDTRIIKPGRMLCLIKNKYF